MVMFSSHMPWDFWLIFTFLAVVIPWRGRVRLRRLLALGAVGTKEKITLYATTIAFQWVLAIVVVWRALARGLTLTELGLSSVGSLRILLPTFIGAFLLGGLHWLNLRRIGQLEGTVPEKMRSLATRILPRSFVEFLPYFALAITAGVCEEFLYRGFAMAALLRAGMSNWLVVLLTAVLFGLAHSYQGRSGILGTSIMGLVFGGFRIIYGSLIPVTVWHAVVDIVAGVAGQKYLLKAQPFGQPGSQVL
jgi:membrane protease YdiL (CAAX protease family)